MLKTMYIAFRFFEREPDDFALVKFVFQSDVYPNELRKELSDLIDSYESSEDAYDSKEAMLNDILASFAEGHCAVWDYCENTMGPFVIGERY